MVGGGQVLLALVGEEGGEQVGPIHGRRHLYVHEWLPISRQRVCARETLQHSCSARCIPSPATVGALGRAPRRTSVCPTDSGNTPGRCPACDGRGRPPVGRRHWGDRDPHRTWESHTPG